MKVHTSREERGSWVSGWVDHWQLIDDSSGNFSDCVGKILRREFVISREVVNVKEFEFAVVAHRGRC